MADNVKFYRNSESFEVKECPSCEYVDWAYDETIRQAKTTRNFIMQTVERLKEYENRISRIYFPKLKRK